MPVQRRIPSRAAAAQRAGGALRRRRRARTLSRIRRRLNTKTLKPRRRPTRGALKTARLKQKAKGRRALARTRRRASR